MTTDTAALTKDKATGEKGGHPLAGKEMTGAELVIQVLADEGVGTLFGYSGGAILATYDALFRYNAEQTEKDQIRLIVPANEQGAGFMAAGYARASGKVGVFMVTSGPGATNCTTPIRDSMADSVPMVLFCGQVARSSIGTDAFQEAPVYNLMSACAKHVFLVEDETQLEATVRTAFAIARSGRPGPVVIDLPKDVQSHTVRFQGGGLLPFRGYERRMTALREAHISDEAAAAFFELLGHSERPLLYAGGGVISGNAAEELRQFAKWFNIPVVTTLMGIGSVDTTEETSLRMLGMHGTAYANYAVEDCDFLIAVGARFDDRVAGNQPEFAPEARIAHIDIDAAEIGKVKAVDWSHAGDAKTALQDLLAAGKDFERDFSPWVKRVVEYKKAHPLDYNRDSELIQPEFVLETLNAITKGEAIVCTGVGQHQMWSALYLDFHQPRSFISSGSMGTMGFGLPASIGAQAACPDRLVIDVDGDGSMRMNQGELETAVTYGLPVKILMMNNQADGMVRQWQHLYYGRRFAATDKTPRTKKFVKTAEADGFEFIRRVTDKADVKKTLEEFIAFNGPAFVEVVVDRDACVYPMVGPGQGYKQMVTGPYIPPR